MTCSMIKYLNLSQARGNMLCASAGEAAARFVNNWAMQAAVRPFVFPLMLSDIHKVLDDDDQAYFREQREKQLGVKLEEARPPCKAHRPADLKHRGLLKLQAHRMLRPPFCTVEQARREVGVTVHTGRS